jgi:hypothetical protein
LEVVVTRNPNIIIEAYFTIIFTFPPFPVIKKPPMEIGGQGVDKSYY